MTYWNFEDTMEEGDFLHKAEFHRSLFSYFFWMD
ncbi:hypothetical protein PEDI_47320 [Persicobacter diffluens]|uniref:Uncharacterized protein n=1 Tax=Persicobacter diffluens TaxID=981 RepID=A0AAN5ALN8_9BACT|nr:hypothetical protein PEDI_47320 [Persicobacter diffluens]